VCVFGGTLVSVASFGMLQQRRWNDRTGRGPGREGSEDATRRNGDGAAAGRSISSTQQDSIWRHVHECVLLLPESDATRGTGQQFGGRTEDMRQRRRMQAAGCCMLSLATGWSGTEQRTCCGQRSRRARKISIQHSRNRFYLTSFSVVWKLISCMLRNSNTMRPKSIDIRCMASVKP